MYACITNRVDKFLAMKEIIAYYCKKRIYKGEYTEVLDFDQIYKDFKIWLIKKNIEPLDEITTECFFNSILGSPLKCNEYKWIGIKFITESEYEQIYPDFDGQNAYLLKNQHKHIYPDFNGQNTHFLENENQYLSDYNEKMHIS